MIFYIFLIFIFQGYLFAQDIKNNYVFSNQSSLKWQLDEKSTELDLIWQEAKPADFKEKKILSKKKETNFPIYSIGKSIKINGYPYPEISNYVPNAFVEDKEKLFTASLRGISKTRHCAGNNFTSKCLDGSLDIDFNLINNKKFSFNPKINIQSLSDRGLTSFAEAITLGFKAAKIINEKWSFAIGGENLIHFDSKSDLGRNFYFVGSTYYPISLFKDSQSFLFFNVGIGSDFYGYKGNGYLARTTCFGVPNLTGEGENNCSWGPIGSATLVLNDRISLINEWFGYGYGSGISIRPFQAESITLSIYATDYIKGFPEGVEDGCHKKKCTPRFYGSISYTF